jgi:hypothetical protein
LKKEKGGKQKVGYDREFMTTYIKEGKLQGKPHCDLDQTIFKERKSSTSRHFQRFQQIFGAVVSGFCRMVPPKVKAPSRVTRNTQSVVNSTKKAFVDVLNPILLIKVGCH